MATAKVPVPSHSSQHTRTSCYTGNLIESLISAVEQAEKVLTPIDVPLTVDEILTRIADRRAA